MDSLSPFSSLPPVFLYVPIFTTVLYLAIHFLVYSRRVAQWRKSKIPFLQPNFLIGHKYFFNLYNSSCLVSIDRIYRENSDKDVVGFFLGTMPIVLVRSPALIKQMFVKNFDKTFQTAMIGSENDEVAEHTISLCSDRDMWKSTRKTLSPMLTTARMSGEAFAKVRKQIERLWAHGEEAHRTGVPIDTKVTTINFMMDCVSSSLFSMDTDSYGKQGDLHRLAADVEPGLGRMLRMYAQMLFPGVWMFNSLRIISKEHINSMANIIRKQMEHKKQHQRDENDFLDFLKKLKGEKSGKQGPEMEITNQMIGFGFVAAFGGGSGIKLTAPMCQGSWAIYCLSLYPEHQERIRREVAEVMQKHNTSEFTYEVVQDLRFTEQCLYETARLYPSVLGLTRICSEDFKVPGWDYTFKKGERVFLSSYSLHRDAAYFENPEKFDPERFSPENKKTITPESYLAFGTGPRKCPSEKLGNFMIATMLASLLYKFELKPRSHVKQMDATGFDPRSFGNIQREDILVDVIPREIMAN